MKHAFGKKHVNYQLLQLFDFEGVFQISFEFLLESVLKTRITRAVFNFSTFDSLGRGLKV